MPDIDPPSIDLARIDDDAYFTAHLTACDPLAKPITPEELQRIRCIYKLDHKLPPRDAAERELMDTYKHVIELISHP